MKLTRYTDTAPIDYMLLADDGEWVPASEALELEQDNARLQAELQDERHENRALRAENSALIMKYVL